MCETLTRYEWIKGVAFQKLTKTARKRQHHLLQEIYTLKAGSVLKTEVRREQVMEKQLVQQVQSAEDLLSSARQRIASQKHDGDGSAPRGRRPNMRSDETPNTCPDKRTVPEVVKKFWEITRKGITGGRRRMFRVDSKPVGKFKPTKLASFVLHVVDFGYLFASTPPPE